MNEHAETDKLILQRLIDFVRDSLGPDLISAQVSFFMKLGQISAVLGGVFGLLIGIVGAIKTDSFILFGAGVGWVILTIFFYYAGAVTLPACDDAIKNSPTKISTFATQVIHHKTCEFWDEHSCSTETRRTRRHTDDGTLH